MLAKTLVTGMKILLPNGTVTKIQEVIRHPDDNIIEVVIDGLRFKWGARYNVTTFRPVEGKIPKHGGTSLYKKPRARRKAKK